MKKMIIAIIIVMILAAVFAGCAQDNKNNTITPTVTPMATGTPMRTEPTATLSPTDVLPTQSPGLVPSPEVTQGAMSDVTQ